MYVCKTTWTYMLVCACHWTYSRRPGEDAGCPLSLALCSFEAWSYLWPGTRIFLPIMEDSKLLGPPALPSLELAYNSTLRIHVFVCSAGVCTPGFMTVQQAASPAPVLVSSVVTQRVQFENVRITATNTFEMDICNHLVRNRKIDLGVM